ncbi:hypothetical protein CRYUN_Cryun20dG0043600 [Craigia yunnanensis]
MSIQKICHWKLGVISCHGHILGSLKGKGKGKEDNPVYGEDSGDDLDDCDIKGISYELGIVEAYSHDMEEWTFWLTMKELFSGSDLYFGNSMDTFFKRLKDMRRLWDECDMSAGVEERLYMWRTRRKYEDSNLLSRMQSCAIYQKE